MKNTPDKKYDDRKDNSLRPSWTGNKDFINDEHRGIFTVTKDIPGWQMEGDTYKLYEMGYFAGDVILEIGTFGGRSAVVELTGALSRHRQSGTQPQFFGIDIDSDSVRRTYESLKQFHLETYALLYQGTLQEFVKEFPIQPTMCFVDGDHRYEGVKRDLDLLVEFLEPGIPVLCHDYTNPENDTGEYGIRKAANEWEEKGYAEFYGVFGCSALFVTTGRCMGKKAGYSAKQFTDRRKTLLDAYGLETIMPGTLRFQLKRFMKKIFGLKRYL
jgi:hypothetical protein